MTIMRPTRPRGLTLIELMIATLIMVTAISTAMVAFISLSRSLWSADQARAANSAARDAMVPIESALRNAGWGLDSRFAIDMTSAARSRDSFTASDELTFLSRNPSYNWLDRGEGTCNTVGGCFAGNAWPVTSVDLAGSPKTVTVVLENTDRLSKGQVIVVTCPNGGTPVMLTLGAARTGTGAAITLTPFSTNAAPYNDFNSLVGCHGLPGAAVFLVERTHFLVSSLGGVPWLMLDSGLDLDGDGTVPPTDTDDLVPLAKNVENFQVAYAMQPSATVTAPDTNRDWIIGNHPNGAIEELDPAAAAPTYTTSATDASRFTKHPANVRSIRVTLTLRSERTDQNRPTTWTGDSVAGGENRTTTVSGGRFHRYTSTSQIGLHNMGTASSFVF